MIICWAAKGGSGTTVVACALALGSGHGWPTTLVDLSGDSATALGLAEPTGPGRHRLVGLTDSGSERSRPPGGDGPRRRSTDPDGAIAGPPDDQWSRLAVGARRAGGRRRRRRHRLPAAATARRRRTLPARHPTVLHRPASGPAARHPARPASCSSTSRAGRSRRATSSTHSVCRWWPRCVSTRRWRSAVDAGLLVSPVAAVADPLACGAQRDRRRRRAFAIGRPGAMARRSGDRRGDRQRARRRVDRARRAADRRGDDEPRGGEPRRSNTSCDRSGDGSIVRTPRSTPACPTARACAQ